MMWTTFAIRWVFIAGFGFLVVVGLWAVVTISRMKREQAIAIHMLEALAAQAGLGHAIDATRSPLRRRRSDV